MLPERQQPGCFAAIYPKINQAATGQKKLRCYSFSGTARNFRTTTKDKHLLFLKTTLFFNIFFTMNTAS
jgi:hypothetical protein